MTYLIDRINEQLSKEGLAARSDASRQWLRNKMTNLKVTKTALIQDRTRQANKSVIGRMYFFFYDPKGKDSLPYYDRFPLVFPIERYSDGFLGLNLHYIHPKQRIILLDKLSEFANNNRYDETTKLRLSYQALSAASKIYEKTPCIKRYLFRQIESRFLEIPANEWDIAALLPAESFIGANKNKVWAESRKNY
jgi:hypothetical protein